MSDFLEELMSSKTAEPVEPTEPVQPTDPVEPIEPVDTADTTEPIEPAADTSLESVQAYIKEKFGAESLDEFNSQFNDFKTKATDYETKSQEWLLEKDTLAQQLEEAKKATKMYDIDDTFVKLNALKEDKDYPMIAQIAIKGADSLSPLEVVKNKMKEDYPDLSDQRIEKLVLKKYKLDATKPDELADDQEVEEWELLQDMGRMDLKKDAKSIISKYEQKLNEVKLPSIDKPSPEVVALQKAQIQKQWTPHLDELISSTGKSSFEIKVGENQEPINLAFELKADDVKKYASIANDFIANNGIAFSDQGVDQVASVMKTLIIKDKLENYVNTAATKAIEATNKMWESKINGGKQDYKQSPAKKGTYDDAMAEFKKQLS